MSPKTLALWAYAVGLLASCGDELALKDQPTAYCSQSNPAFKDDVMSREDAEARLRWILQCSMALAPDSPEVTGARCGEKTQWRHTISAADKARITEGIGHITGPVAQGDTYNATRYVCTFTETLDDGEPRQRTVYIRHGGPPALHK